MSVLPTSNEGATMESTRLEPLRKSEAAQEQHCGCGCGCPCCEPHDEPAPQAQRFTPDPLRNDAQVPSSPSEVGTE